MNARRNDRRIAQEPHYLRLEKLSADRRTNDRRGPADAIREKLAQQLAEQRELNAELAECLAWAMDAGNLRYYTRLATNAKHCDAVDRARAALAKAGKP